MKGLSKERVEEIQRLYKRFQCGASVARLVKKPVHHTTIYYHLGRLKKKPHKIIKV